MTLKKNYIDLTPRVEPEPAKRINDKRRRKINRLVKAECCNYQQGNCLLLDDGEPVSCPQLISSSLSCRWFRDAVLPIDKELHAEIMGQTALKKCSVCGQPFRAVSNRAKYCERCRKSERRKHEDERVRNTRKNKVGLYAFRGQKT